MKLLNLFFLCGFIGNSSALRLSNLLTINNKIYEHYDKLGESKQYFEPNLFSTIHAMNETPDVYHRFLDKIELLDQTVGKETVKFVSAALPHVDQIGHQILHANNIYINDILNNPSIPHDIQKQLILISIKLAQYGDDMGSELLKLYYSLVESCL